MIHSVHLDGGLFLLQCSAFGVVYKVFRWFIRTLWFELVQCDVRRFAKSLPKEVDVETLAHSSGFVLRICLYLGCIHARCICYRCCFWWEGCLHHFAPNKIFVQPSYPQMPMVAVISRLPLRRCVCFLSF